MEKRESALGAGLNYEEIIGCWCWSTLWEKRDLGPVFFSESDVLSLNLMQVHWPWWSFIEPDASSLMLKQVYWTWCSFIDPVEFVLMGSSLLLNWNWTADAVWHFSWNICPRWLPWVLRKKIVEGLWGFSVKVPAPTVNLSSHSLCVFRIKTRRC